MFSSLLGLLASIHAVVFDGLQTPLGELADKPVIAKYESTVHLRARFNAPSTSCIGRWTTVRELHR